MQVHRFLETYGSMCCWCKMFRSKSATCVCAVVVLHVVLLVTLVTALFTRLYVYSPNVHGDMPFDRRLVLREGSSVFCSRHVAQSFLVDSSTSHRVHNHDELNSNTLPEFDLYTFDKDPSGPDSNLTTQKKLNHMQSLSSLFYEEHEYHHFNLMHQSDVNFSVCSEYPTNDYVASTKNNATGLYAYFIKGTMMFDSIVSDIKGGRWTVPCRPGSPCPRYVHVPPKTTFECETGEGSGDQFTSFQTRVNTSDEYYVLFYNPDSRYEGQKYKVVYDLNRTQWDLREVVPTYVRTNKREVSPDQFIIVSFNYTLNSPSNKLYNIELDYVCEPEVLLYLSVFFFLPVALLMAIGVALYCCHERRVFRQDYMQESASSIQWESDYSQASGYGSTDPVYT